MSKRKTKEAPKASHPARDDDGPIKAKQDAPGVLYGSNTMFLRENCGVATLEDGRKYELTTNIGGGTPIVRSEQSGRWWTIGWKELVTLAIAAGIDEKDEKEHPR